MQQCSTWGCCYSAQKCCLMIDCLSQCTPELQGQPTQKLDLLEQWQMMLPGLKKLIFKWFIKVSRATINKHEGKDCWKEKKPWFSGYELNTNYFGLRGQFIPYCSLYSDTADSCFCLVHIPTLTKALLKHSGDAKKTFSFELKTFTWITRSLRAAMIFIEEHDKGREGGVHPLSLQTGREWSCIVMCCNSLYEHSWIICTHYLSLSDRLSGGWAKTMPCARG